MRCSSPVTPRMIYGDLDTEYHVTVSGGRSDRKRKRISYSLIVTPPDGPTRVVPVGQAAITVGRSPATSIRVSEEGVSRQHCVITPSGGRLMLLDQGSTNGTYLNGARVQQARLGHGDIVRIGSTKIRVEALSETPDDLSLTPTYPAPAITTATKATPRWCFDLVGRLAGRLARSVGAMSAAGLILDTLFDAFPVDRAYILMVRQGTRDLEVDVLANKSRHPASGELDLVIPELVLEAMHRNPSLVGAAEATPAVAAAVRKRYSGPLLATPLRQGNRISGALYLDALTMPEWSRSEDMLALLSVIGDIASLALSRSRLQAELLSEQRLSEARRSGTDREGGEGVSDIERIRADQELELAARLEEVHQVSETQANLARGLVHDVRSIASVIRSNIELAGRELPAEAMAATALREAAHYGRNLVELAEDIATLSQLQEGAQVLHTERVDVGTLIEETVAVWADHAADRGILMSRVMPTPLIVVVDRTILGRVLGHLIGNSLRSAADGGRVLITARASAHTVDIVVNDSDSDQPLEVLATASQGAEPSEEDARHQSVGIDFCRMAIEAHGGSLRVEGREGEPSRYVITLPGALHVSRGGPATMEQDTRVTPAPHGKVTPHLGSETEPGE